MGHEELLENSIELKKILEQEDFIGSDFDKFKKLINNRKNILILKSILKNLITYSSHQDFRRVTQSSGNSTFYRE
jgi:hypothetical protein